MFGLGSQSQQNNGMNLSQSHGSMGMGAQQSPFSLGAQPMQQQQQQGFMGSMMGGMGMTPQQQMMAQQWVLYFSRRIQFTASLKRVVLVI